MKDFTVVSTMFINMCGKFMYMERIPHWQLSWPGTSCHSMAFSASFHRQGLLNLWRI